MRIYQVVPTIMLGDGVSQEVLEIEKILSTLGYRNKIFAGNIITPKLRKKIELFSDFPVVEKEDIIIYHLSTGSYIVDQLLNVRCKLIIIYHNITPSKWFTKYDKNLEIACMKGREDILKLSKKANYCLADSMFNAQELKQSGYTCPIAVLPIVIDFEKFNYSYIVNNSMQSKRQWNILFTGRIVPNKKVEDVIKSFYYLQKKFNVNVKLNLIGNYYSDDVYYKKLVRYIQKLGVRDVMFHGHVSERKLVDIYRETDLYLSLSEHEGFCIPLLEAMYFQIPVIAYNRGGVEDTMQGAGILLDSKNPMVIAGIIKHIIADKEIRNLIVAEQNERLKNYMDLKQAVVIERVIKEVLK